MIVYNIDIFGFLKIYNTITKKNIFKKFKISYNFTF
jgi:hypothetical protein